MGLFAWDNLLSNVNPANGLTGSYTFLISETGSATAVLFHIQPARVTEAERMQERVVDRNTLDRRRFLQIKAIDDIITN